MSAIPSEIAHLDFVPQAEDGEDTSRLKECQIEDCRKRRFRQSPRLVHCHRVARWVVTFRCCGDDGYCCDHHKGYGTWFCRRCKVDRGEEWLAWRRV